MPSQSKTQDTCPEAEMVLVELIRKQPAAVRLRNACSATQLVVAQCKNALRRRHPDLSDEEVNLRFIEINYGKELADKVRIWAQKRQSS